MKILSIVDKVNYEIARFLFTGFGRTSWQVFLVSALIMLAVLNETMGISILIPAAHCDLHLSATDKGMLTGVSFAGKIFTYMIIIST